MALQRGQIFLELWLLTLLTSINFSYAWRSSYLVDCNKTINNTNLVYRASIAPSPQMPLSSAFKGNSADD